MTCLLFLRSLDAGSYNYFSVPQPRPTSLGFPAIGSFENNFHNKVVWSPVRSKRDVSDQTTDLHSAKDESKNDLVKIVEEELSADSVEEDEESVKDKRDALPAASRLDHHHVLPPPHDVPPHSALPLFPPLGTPPPHHGPTPVPAAHHHVTISTPTHHVSHGVADHGTHHAVHKEHHQVHGHGLHPIPVVQHHMMDHHAALPLLHHEPVHHEVHHAPVHGPAHHDVHAVHHPHQPAAPVVMLPPAPAVHHYDNPITGYPKPAYGGSLEDIFGLNKPKYHEPAPAYHAPKPAYHEPKPAYHEPKPAYHEPKPAYHEPKPAYKPDYAHPTGDYVSPDAHMAGHPFSLESVFNLGMPLYYMKKYPHMAHMMHHGHHGHHHVDHHVEHHPEPAYHAPKPTYHDPPTGYAKPTHGASLEEIFGIGSSYHPAPHPAPAYHPPTPVPAYHPPEPAYHPPTPAPAYHAPEPAYHPPEPAYHPPEPAYHPPTPAPAYHAPEPAYHSPTPAPYHPAPTPTHHGSLEAVFGLTPRGYVTPAPLYDLPTTYKPKMPDYLTGKVPHAKSLPPPQDPGYVLHYLPYDNYQPHHPETLAHPPPVPHLPHAAHMLVPGTHVPPPLPAAPILHPHAALEGAASVPIPQPSFLPSLGSLRGARQKRSPQTGQSPSSPHLTNTLDTPHLSPSSQPDGPLSLTLTDFDSYDPAESRLLGLFNSSDVMLQLCSHSNNQTSSWSPCLIPGGQLAHLDLPPGLAVTSPNLFKNLPKNNFQPIDVNNLQFTQSEFVNIPNITENTTTKKLTKLVSEPKVSDSSTLRSKIFHTPRFDHFIEDTTTSTSTPPFQSTTPGSIPSTPSWIFPTEGSRKKTQKQSVIQAQTQSSVYFDPSLRKDFNDLNKVDV